MIDERDFLKYLQAIKQINEESDIQLDKGSISYLIDKSISLCAKKDILMTKNEILEEKLNCIRKMVGNFVR